MKAQDLSQAKDPDLRGSLAAMQRAAALARKIAIQTDIGIGIKPPAWGSPCPEDTRQRADATPAPAHAPGQTNQRTDPMPRITLHLDVATQALVAQAAKANGTSKSRWVAEIIRKHVAPDWPQGCVALAGRFADFPLREDKAAALPADTARRGS